MISLQHRIPRRRSKRKSEHDTYTIDRLLAFAPRESRHRVEDIRVITSRMSHDEKPRNQNSLRRIEQRETWAYTSKE